MRIAMVAAKFSDAEVNELRKAMATFRRRGTIGLLEEKMVARMVARGYDQEFAAALLQPDQGLRRVRLSRKPRRELRPSRLCLGLAQVPLPGGVRVRAAQLAADGLLCAGADRARCARAWRRGARASTSTLAIGTARWRPAAQAAGRRCGSACARSTACRRTRCASASLRVTAHRAFTDVRRSCGVRAAACPARRRSRSSPPPTPSARSASTAARRCGR